MDDARNDSSPAMRVSLAGGLRPSREAVIQLLLIAATIGTFFPVLSFDFVGLDDQVTVFQNWNLVHLSASTFYSFWTEPQGQLYTPLTYSLFAAISLAAHIAPKAGEVLAVPFYAGPFHAVSLMLHVLGVMIVYRLLRRLIGPPWPSAAGALLFAIHPVQVESVAWVTATNGLLCGVLSLAAVLVYLTAITPPPPARVAWRMISWSRFFLATEIFLLALLAKPLAVIVPLLALALHWLVNPREEGSLAPSRLIRRHVPWPLTIWIILALPFAIIARLCQPIPDWWLVVPIWQRPFIAGDALCFYIYKIVYPRTLTVDYGRSPGEIFARGWAWYTWIIPAVLAASVVVFHRRQAARPIVAGMIWFVIALFPVLGFTRFAFERFSTVADRYLYLPMFGVALAAAWGLNRFAQWNATRDVRHMRIARRAVIIVCIGAGVLLGTRTFLQTQYWRNKRTLFQHSQDVIHRTPGAPQVN